MKKYLLSLTLLLLSLSINAQAPQGFNYQAHCKKCKWRLGSESECIF